MDTPRVTNLKNSKFFKLVRASSFLKKVESQQSNRVINFEKQNKLFAFY